MPTILTHAQAEALMRDIQHDAILVAGCDTGYQALRAVAQTRPELIPLLHRLTKLRASAARLIDVTERAA